MVVQIPLDQSDVTGEAAEGDLVQIANDVAFLRLAIANVVFVGQPGVRPHDWVLVDAGITGSADAIRSAAEARFGQEAKPACIILTHGHFDHVGALRSLAESWDVPVYAHLLEQPFLDGSQSYPPADPWVGGGLMAMLSPLFPRKPVDVGSHLRPLPSDGTVPAMPGWRWIHTPGHTPGHVSFWREGDRTLIAGDAFITTGQESAYEVVAQTPEMHGPPRYFTPDWAAAGRSVATLAALEPELVVSGHGQALRGKNMQRALHRLAMDFDRIAVPNAVAPAEAD